MPWRDGIEWRLSALHWSRAGLAAFVRNEVPFVVNNSGRLSEDAAALLYQACLTSARPEGRILVVEVGAGLGLFARYLLDAFKAICEKERRPFYERLLLVVTDSSRITVEQWRDAGLFDAHREHVVLATCDACDPTSIRPLDPDGTPPFDLADLKAVFCNYILDVLPAAIARRVGDRFEELYVRTVLTNDRDLLAQQTTLTHQQICALAASEKDDDRAQLLPLLGLFDMETDFREVAAEARPGVEEAFALDPTAERLLVNFGALQAVRAWTARLGDGGFLLLNDYGGSGGIGQDAAEPALVPQRFGATMAFGLSFSQIERALRTHGRRVDAGEGDERRAVHTRLVTKGPLPELQAAFRGRFSFEADQHAELPMEDARTHTTAGRKDEALGSYRLALDRNPRDWQLIGEIAELVGLELQDYPAGAELARSALALNPWFSPWLFNVLGDCLFCQGQFADAHRAYLDAARVDPNDPRANLSLAHTLARSGELSEALSAVSRGLVNDTKGHFRLRLVDKQAQILDALTARTAGDRERMQQRLDRLR